MLRRRAGALWDQCTTDVVCLLFHTSVFIVGKCQGVMVESTNAAKGFTVKYRTYIVTQDLKFGTVKKYSTRARRTIHSTSTAPVADQTLVNVNKSAQNS